MRFLSALLMVSGILGAAGCSMCAPGYLDDYATVGGKWQRSDPTHGRVGSIFSDAGETISTGGVDGHYLEHPAQELEGEVFGEAYTESYQEGMEQDQEFGELPSNSTYYEGPEGEGELMLSDGW